MRKIFIYRSSSQTRETASDVYDSRTDYQSPYLHRPLPRPPHNQQSGSSTWDRKNGAYREEDEDYDTPISYQIKRGPAQRSHIPVPCSDQRRDFVRERSKTQVKKMKKVYN